ncbi:MAG: arsenite methyltransferase [Cyclobacteriaceae bacterium]|mgnify:CR=1 FL=1|jgi:ubiquinone/menaquinone biosynthesis C-methylase UbiE
MHTAEELKSIVKEKYGDIAKKSSVTESPTQSSGCCGEKEEKTATATKSSCCGGKEEKDYSVLAEDYASLKGYNPDADLQLGCGIPTKYAQIHEGDTVVDLGSGAGNDCFVARALTGEQGRVIGLDFTEAMVSKAKSNAQKLGFTNVEFILGEIENVPLPDNTADVVVSNCVMNLVPDKDAAFKETYRILKKGGHFSISDIVLQGEIPEGLRNDAAMYAGCVSGALQKKEYLDIVRRAGFKNLVIQIQKKMELDDAIYLKYFTEEEVVNFKKSFKGIFSITLNAEK